MGTANPRVGKFNVADPEGPLSAVTLANTSERFLIGISPKFATFDDSTDNSNLGAIRVSENWPFVPSEIEIGVPFRLIFLTSDRTAGSSQNDSDYNRFVQDAAAGHTAIHPYSDQFTAVVSTNADNARDNTSTTGTGVPIYWLNGAKAAYNYGDFYNGTWTDEAHRKDETGNPNTRTQAWTGSDDDGTEFVDPNTSDSHAVGTANPRVGKFNVADPEGPLSAVTLANMSERSLIGISPKFATFADLGNLTNTKGDRRNNETLAVPNTDTVNHYRFTLDREKSVRIVAERQETDNARLTVVDEDDNVVFKADSRGWYGTGSDSDPYRDYYDQVGIRVIGPGTWNIRMKQTGPTDNTFNLKWDVEDAPVFPNDDYAAGIWTTGTVDIGSSADGTIEHIVEHPGQDLNKRDNDWFAVVLELGSKYKFVAVPSGMNTDIPLICYTTPTGRTYN